MAKLIGTFELIPHGTDPYFKTHIFSEYRYSTRAIEGGAEVVSLIWIFPDADLAERVTKSLERVIRSTTALVPEIDLYHTEAGGYLIKLHHPPLEATVHYMPEGLQIEVRR